MSAPRLPVAVDDEPVPTGWMRVADFALAMGISERTAWRLVSAGDASLEIWRPASRKQRALTRVRVRIEKRPQIGTS